MSLSRDHCATLSLANLMCRISKMTIMTVHRMMNAPMPTTTPTMTPTLSGGGVSNVDVDDVVTRAVAVVVVAVVGTTIGADVGVVVVSTEEDIVVNAVSIDSLEAAAVVEDESLAVVTSTDGVFSGNSQYIRKIMLYN